MQFLKYDPMKNAKSTYYVTQCMQWLVPDMYYRRQREKWIAKYHNDPEVRQRVMYYNRLKAPVVSSEQAKTIRYFKYHEPKKTYYFDLLSVVRFFDPLYVMEYLFGDITYVPASPSFVKSRPIASDNAFSVLLNLNKVRHFNFVEDPYSFESKKKMLVWRGKAYKEHRQAFLQRFYNHPLCDIGQTNTKGDLDVPWQKDRLSILEQLSYKYILSIEGNDVASNLKWAMSSNSLVLMTRPRFETWFMEGTLIPNYHYVLLEDDYSDLEAKIEYYTLHVDEAQTIIDNAHMYVSQFLDQEREHAIALMVAQHYFTMINQRGDQ